jgi:outer membrane protein TolC
LAFYSFKYAACSHFTAGMPHFFFGKKALGHRAPGLHAVGRAIFTSLCDVLYRHGKILPIILPLILKFKTIMSVNIRSGQLPLLLFFLFAKILSAQPVQLDLKEAIQRTTANNFQVKIANYELAAALEDLDKMKSIFLPQVTVSATGMATNTPLNAFGTKLQQGAITQADFNPDDLNGPASIGNLNTQIMVQQPILNLDAMAMKKAVAAKSDAYNYQAVRTNYVLQNHVVKAYLQLQLMYEMMGVLQQAKNTAEANLKLANDNLEAGYIQRADVLSVEVRINEIATQLFQVENNIQHISDQLSFLMGTEPGQIYTPAEALEYRDESAILSENMPANRSDILAMQSQVAAHENMLDAADKTRLPRLNAFGSYDLNNSLDFGDSQHGYMIGLQAAWTIFNGNKNKSDMRKSQIEVDKSRTQMAQVIAQNTLEIAAAKRKMTEAQQKLKLTETAIQQSKEVLRIKTDRFAEGLERTTDILMAETTVSQKEMEYAQAVFEYKIAYADLLLLLEKN